MTSEDINLKLEEFRNTFFDKDFSWRKGQKEAIIEILLTYYKKSHNVVILDCPTGGGKSIIAMAVSWILNQDSKKGYILTSDISLQEQYERDFNRYNFSWGSVKGVDNYVCIDNMQKTSNGTCHIRNKPPKKMHCYNSCPYYTARDIAAASSTSLLNYSYWLIMMNYVYTKMGAESIFLPRDFTICDEAHKILDIVQNHYSPRFDSKVLKRLEDITHFFSLYKLGDHSLDFKEVKENIESLFNTENQDELSEILLNIEKIFEKYLVTYNTLKDTVNKKYKNEEPPKEWKEMLYLYDWLKDLHCKVEDYNTIIQNTSVRNLIKNSLNEKEIVFNCLEESYLMHKYFHRWTGFTVLMSATFADASKYLRSIALKDAKYIKIKSQFNFDMSPIYFYNKRKMSYSQIEQNLPWLYQTINEILDKHANENGIIHTASYDLSIKILNNLSRKNKRRVLVYNGSEEKREVLNILKNNKNKVLMGPSLIEGLDLKDDWSRFTIFAKVPYLSLKDRFVATKLKINPDWYREKAIISLLQGTGRSIRNENDWAITYILDGSMADLMHTNRKSFPEEFINRIRIIED